MVTSDILLFWTKECISGHCRNDREILKISYQKTSSIRMRHVCMLSIKMNSRSKSNLPTAKLDIRRPIYKKCSWDAWVCILKRSQNCRAEQGRPTLSEPQTFYLKFKGSSSQFTMDPDTDNFLWTGYRQFFLWIRI